MNDGPRIVEPGLKFTSGKASGFVSAWVQYMAMLVTLTTGIFDIFPPVPVQISTIEKAGR
jgi:hypothetical protein